MRIIVDHDVLRQFERKTGAVFGLLQTVVDAVTPLNPTKLRDLANELTVDRFNLAKGFLSQAQAQDLSTKNGQKVVISRSYYAMYHAGRTVIFHYERADVDVHENIPKRLPSNLPNRSHWTNRLVEWRKRRNQADYSPYPEGDLHVLAKQILLEAETFLDLCASFLKGRGVPYV